MLHLQKYFIFWLSAFLLFPLSSTLYGQNRLDSLQASLQGANPEAQVSTLLQMMALTQRSAPTQEISLGYRTLEILASEPIPAETAWKVYQWMGQTYMLRQQQDSSEYFIEKLQQLARQEKDETYLMEALMLSGELNNNLGNQKEVQSNFSQAIELSQKLNLPQKTVACLISLGSFEKSIGNLENALDYFYQAADASKEHELLRQYAQSIGNANQIYLEQGKYTKAIQCIQEIIPIFRQIGDINNVATSLNDWGVIKYREGDYDSCLYYFYQVVDIWEQQEDSMNLMLVLGNIAEINRLKGDFSEALKINFEVLEVLLRWDLKPGLIPIYNNIGILYGQTGELENSEKFHQKSLALAREANRLSDVATSLNNLAIIYEMIDKQSKARASFLEALEIWKQLGNQMGVASNYHNLGALALEEGNLQEAKNYLFQAKNLRASINDAYGLSESLLKISELFEGANELDSALICKQQALVLADSVASQVLLRDIHESKAALLKKMGRYEEALIAYEAFKAANDSIYNSESQSVIAELQQKYLTKEQKQQIALLEKEKQLQRFWVIGLISGVILLSLIAYLIFSRYRLINRSHSELDRAFRQLQQTQQQLIQAEKMASLGKLTAGIAHEIKNPLNFVNNFAQGSIELANELEGELRKNIQALGEEEAQVIEEIIADLKVNANAINRQGQRADSIIKSMMEHAGDRQAERKATDLNHLITGAVKLGFHGFAGRQDPFSIQLVENYDASLPGVNLVPQEISRVILNMLNNAYDAIEEKRNTQQNDYQPLIRVSTHSSGNEAEIRIRDNGMGLNNTLKDQIFEPFFTTKSTQQGNIGLGLSIVHDIIVQGHHGRLEVESEPGEFTEFIIRLPIVSSED